MHRLGDRSRLAILGLSLRLAFVALGAGLVLSAAGLPFFPTPSSGMARDKTRSARAGCVGPLELLLESGFCSHGPDPAPPGLDVSRRVKPLSRSAARAGTTSLCDGDGVSGYRVQAIYVGVQGAPDRYSQYLSSIRAWVAGADAIMQASAAETGGSRHFRFVTDAACQIEVQAVTLPQADASRFDAMIGALSSRGFSRPDRFYLSFVDSSAFGYCGIATYWGDDRPEASNANNSGPAYSRVDAGCWDAGVVAHELLHNLGGVQRSAPHSTAHGHCIDEWDVMCYADASNVTMQYVCSSPTHDDLYDCNHDDYFHTDPASGSYLATHWNTANSRFLIEGGSGIGVDIFPPTVAISHPQSGARLKGKKTITVTASASDADSGVAAVEFRRCRGTSCAWDAATTLGPDNSAPFTVRWTLPKRGSYTILTRAVDQDGNVAISDPVTVRIKKKR
jgi:hypothetical protein